MNSASARSFLAAAKALSRSSARASQGPNSCTPNDRAATSDLFKIQFPNVRPDVFVNVATREALGIVSLTSSNHFPLNSGGD